MTTASELLDVAEDLMTRPSAESHGRWPRAAAILARQAIEASIDQLDPALAEVTKASPRLMALRALLHDRAPEEPGLADEVDHAYGALSRMVHHHAYELAPGLGELRHVIDIARRLDRSLAELKGTCVPVVPPSPVQMRRSESGEAD